MPAIRQKTSVLITIDKPPGWSTGNHTMKNLKTLVAAIVAVLALIIFYWVYVISAWTVKSSTMDYLLFMACFVSAVLTIFACAVYINENREAHQ